jgi:hypothetical protein
MVHYHRYLSVAEIDSYLEKHDKEIQAIVGKRYLPFGTAQNPALHVYADNVNTLEWLANV